MEERLQKIMAQAGLGSRRSCEELIAAGRVTVNGKVAILGNKADPAIDRIMVDRQPLKTPDEFIYIAINKPRGVLSTVSDPDPRPTVRELVDLPGQFYPVGRLDVDSEGLVLLTNDGDLTNRLTHPRYGHEKEYRVLVARRPDEEQLATWRRGVVLDDGYRTTPADIHTEEPSGKGMWLRIVLREGRKRQIRETGSILGLPVVKIIRVRIGTLYLGSLKPRQWRLLTNQEIEALKRDPKPARKTQKRAQPRRPLGVDRFPEKREGPRHRSTQHQPDLTRKSPSKSRSTSNKPKYPPGKKRPVRRNIGTNIPSTGSPSQKQKK
jgi:23S rRNA pseudouridine2605 synthase